MKYFCYMNKSGRIIALENPNQDIDPDYLWDLCYSFGYIEAKTAKSAIKKCEPMKKVYA